MIGIYKITNLINNKVYIGQSVSIQERWKAHRHRPFNPNSVDCGKEIYSQSTRCIQCNNKNKRTAPKVSRDELKTLIRTMPFTKIGEKYGVSDRTIRKWCDKYGLPRKVTDIKKITDFDWAKI